MPADVIPADVIRTALRAAMDRAVVAAREAHATVCESVCREAGWSPAEDLAGDRAPPAGNEARRSAARALDASKEVAAADRWLMDVLGAQIAALRILDASPEDAEYSVEDDRRLGETIASIEALASSTSIAPDDGEAADLAALLTRLRKAAAKGSPHAR